jgi:hypothetical protein
MRDSIKEITLTMRKIIQDHPQGFLVERNEYLYQDKVEAYNYRHDKQFDGNRGALLVAVMFILVVTVAVVAALN